MRPVRLEVEGFGAFRERTDVEFDGVDLFALVGPTGSGKSTVIDAICFALYGSVPRYGHKGSVAPVVTMGAGEAKVSLTFEAAARRYIATRVVRRGKTGASTREARLEAVDGAVLAGSAAEMGPAVHELLGLTFEQFTRAVVLPQNEFARFLHDTPGDRQDLLVTLLGFDVYERMMQRARQLAAEQEASVALAGQRLEALADCTDEQRATWAEWVEVYAELRREVRDARDTLRALETETAAAVDAARRERTVVEVLAAVAIPDAFGRLVAERADVDAELAAATDALAGTAASLAEAQGALDALGSRDPLVAAQRLFHEFDGARVALDEAVTRRDKAEAALAPATTARVDAEAALEQLQVAHAAHELVGALAVGEPCPVCEQPVAKVPRRRAPAALTTARKRAEKARAQERAAGDEAARAKESVTELERRVAGLAGEVGGFADLAAVERQLAALDAAAAAVATARAAEGDARKREAAARAAQKKSGERMQRATTMFRSQRDALVGAGAGVPPESGDVVRDWPVLAGWAEKAAPEHASAATAAEAKAAEVATKRDARLHALVARAIECEVELEREATVDDLVEGIATAAEQAKGELDRITAGIKERAALEEQIASTGAEVGVARELARLLDAKHFERWLAAEALEVLVAGASERLRELSGDQYSLAAEEGSRDLLVVDHRNADERRSVRTLSGGETFQASLALALALADQLAALAADGAARLEAIFLDEGFGALDPDTLETVAGTIENLGSGDRMVGIVTHVRDLAERMPVQYRVTRGPRTATVERVSR